MKAIHLYRFGHWAFNQGIPILPSIMTKIIYLLFNCYVPASCSIGNGTVLGYGGIGVVIHARAQIGQDCIIGSGVTIGGRSRKFGVPRLGNRVYVATGAKVLGDITIGDNVVIGANAVVLRDVPSGCVVAGVPADIIRTGVRMEDYV